MSELVLILLALLSILWLFDRLIPTYYGFAMYGRTSVSDANAFDLRAMLITFDHAREFCCGYTAAYAGANNVSMSMLRRP